LQSTLLIPKWGIYKTVPRGAKEKMTYIENDVQKIRNLISDALDNNREIVVVKGEKLVLYVVKLTKDGLLVVDLTSGLISVLDFEGITVIYDVHNFADIRDALNAILTLSIIDSLVKTKDIQKYGVIEMPTVEVIEELQNELNERQSYSKAFNDVHISGDIEIDEKLNIMLELYKQTLK